jgi:predicted acyltransferase
MRDRANRMEPSAPALTEKFAPERLLSVDAFRGFDMFWLVGGYEIVKALVAWIGWAPLSEAAEREMDHPVWSGFHWWDVIMPTFIFISGVTIPLSVTRRLERGEAASRIYWRLLQRLVILQLLDLVYYGALQHLDWHQIRFGGVLARIGWSYFFAALIVMHAKPRQQFIWAIGILLGYWAAMTLIPVPGTGTGLMTPDGNLAGYIDRALMPGVLYGELYEREGLYATLPTVTTVLLGALAGHWLLSNRKGGVKVIGLIATGVGCRLVGQLWSLSMPINTKMWTPSLVLAAGGWSLIFLALFYLVIDVWGFRRWAFFFVVIGMNSILIYVLPVVIDFDRVGQNVFHGAVVLLPKVAQPLAFALCVTVGIKWLLLWFLYRKRIFLRA